MGPPLPILFFVKCLLDIQFTIAFDVLETKWRKNAVMDTATKTDVCKEEVQN